ncbi:MAG TPA: hypothetical protein VK771_11025 [Acidimicrobiia bacterium]|nr:hypothetical protein [Acidimicrobiia bacterium]
MSPIRSFRRATAVIAAVAIVGALALVGCGSGSKPHGATPTSGSGAPTAAQLAEAKRLIDPDNEPTAPSAATVQCVARVVVLNPNIDQVANDMAQIQNKDLRQLVMTEYLRCGYDYVLNLYMRFAPAGLSAPQLACIRRQFTQLQVSRLAEVMVEDPDAGYTGPLVIHACKTGATTDPLLHGTLPGMGSSS